MNVALIPVRGGSKSVPLKNIKEILGQPLVYWTVKAASECRCIDKVYVSTDSEKIRDVVNNFKEKELDLFGKVEVIGRSKESASDTASTEFAMLEFAAGHDFENIVLIQATSPLLTSDDLEGGFQLLKSPNTDSVLSCVRQYRFLWEENDEGEVYPWNYDLGHRPRRQEFPGYLMENGAFYITSRERLLKEKKRISGKIKAYEMNEDTAFEIDEPRDWVIVESLMKRYQVKKNGNETAVKMFLTDCDGCLTDGGMYYSEKGDELKKFHTRDGMGFALLKERGILTGIITGEKSDIVKRRARKLQIDEVHQGVKNKLETIERLAAKYHVSLEEIAYVGDDVNDREALEKVGFSCTVNNASEEMTEKVNYVSKRNGGEGAVREIIDRILTQKYEESE